MSDIAAPANAEVDQDRRGFLIFATTATGAIGAGFATVPFIASWNPSERARAAGSAGRSRPEQDRTRPDAHHPLSQEADVRRASHAGDGGFAGRPRWAA